MRAAITRPTFGRVRSTSAQVRRLFLPGLFFADYQKPETDVRPVRCSVTASRITFEVDVGLGGPRRIAPAEDNVWDQYASLAAHYYVSGRFAAQAGYVPLCGNLMHHAVELQLKCGLIKAGAVPSSAPRVRVWSWFQRLLRLVGFRIALPEDADRYLQRKYGHSLRKAWRDFKRCHAMQDLSAFDQIIRGLERWEEIRYPKHGIAMSVERMATQSPTAPPSGPGMKGVRVYVLNVERIDQFMQHMWSLMSVSPEFFKSAIRATHVSVGASVYEDHNVHMIYH